MKKKLTILAFGLLLAVGWTNDASAQRLPERKLQNVKFEAPRPATAAGQPSRAQSRATVTANVVHDRAFYDGFTYTWSGGTSKITDVADKPDQMANLIKFIYTEPRIPGILYSAAHGEDHPYPNIEFGYNIAEPLNNSTNYGEGIYINIPWYFFLIESIEVYSGNTRVTYWTPGYNTTNFPSDWATNGVIQMVGNYICNISEDETSVYGADILIPGDLINGRSNLTVRVTGYLYNGIDYDGQGLGDEYRTMAVNHQNKKWTTTSTTYTFNILGASATGTVTPPTENGYTALVVKVQDNINFDPVNDEFTYSWSDITNFFSKYIKSIELMTDGLRVGEGSDRAGTVFAYTGILDKFFIISKGKMAYLSSLYSSRAADRAPFYSMYEEFSPYLESESSNQKDLYADMKAGDYYPVQHDCQGVIYRDHFFSMAGKDTIAPKSVSPLVFYIPDNRGSEETWRNYDPKHMPQVGLYTINLSAETEPNSTWAQDSSYIVYLDWSSSLNQMVNNNVNQTYIIYKVYTDSLGHRSYELLDTVYNETTYDYLEKQQMYSQTFTYVILGYPTDATNNFARDGIFWVYSNDDDVQIPGLFDFMVLYRERYESDFVIQEEKNYYRNYIYPTNLAPGTGMTMGQLKKEWPNQTASYTLWRDNLGVAKLEVRAIRDKVYYRIRYYENTQVITGPNAPENTEMDYNYVEIPNDNN